MAGWDPNMPVWCRCQLLNQCGFGYQLWRQVSPEKSPYLAEHAEPRSCKSKSIVNPCLGFVWPSTIEAESCWHTKPGPACIKMLWKSPGGWLMWKLPCQCLLLFPALQTLVLVINGSMKNLFLLLFLWVLYSSAYVFEHRGISLLLCALLSISFLCTFSFSPTAEPFRHP